MNDTARLLCAGGRCWLSAGRMVGSFLLLGTTITWYHDLLPPITASNITTSNKQNDCDWSESSTLISYYTNTMRGV